MIWCGSTEVFNRPAQVHQSLKEFEAGLAGNDPDIAPSQIYAYAALKMGIPYANGAPNLTTDTPVLLEMARATQPADLRQGLQDRPDLHEDADRARTKGADAGDVGMVFHQHPGQSRRRGAGRPGLVQVQGRNQAIRPRPDPSAGTVPAALRQSVPQRASINYYPPRGDAKEGWDNIDIFGWLGYPMQIKINFLCRDSILAAPLVLDLVLFLDLAHRAGMRGIQEWLSFYFKAPMHAPNIYPEHDIFIQLMKLKNTLRWMRGEDLITHLGLEYYD